MSEVNIIELVDLNEKPTESNPLEHVVMLRPMSEAPKDGTKIILMWATPSADINEYDIRICWWWKPTVLHQWEAGARPHWEYVSDKFSCMSVKEPMGWLPIPKAT